jgi:hypothetical protein
MRPGGKRLQFEIQATHHGGFVATLIVDAERYAKMDWPETLGSIFTVASGRGVRAQLREAVQLISHHETKVPRTAVFTSLGWHEYDGHAIYCHAGGVIGAAGEVEGVEVAVCSQLSGFRLPPPADNRSALLACFDAHLRIAELGAVGTKGARAARAILATLPWRAALKPFNTAIHVGGPSGNRKTSLGLLLVKHFSTEFKGRLAAPPESWRSTDNAILGVAHQAKDGVLHIDDLKEDRDGEKAERVFQSIGDGRGRSRMGHYQSLRESLRPRGSVVSTGEIDVKTVSALGRVLVAVFMAGDISLDVLSALQDAADAGRFATLMSSYIRHVAANREAVLAEQATLEAECRQKLGPFVGAHPRHAEAIADLIGAYRVFLRWAVGEGLVDQQAAKDHLTTIRKDLEGLGASQVEFQADAKIGRRFLDLVASGLSSGRCHLVNLDTDGPPSAFAEAAGWRWEAPSRPTDSGFFRVPPGSKGVGWISERDGKVYLDPISSKAIATEMMQLDRNPQSLANLGRELIQEKLVEPGSDGKASQNKKIHGCSK